MKVNTYLQLLVSLCLLFLLNTAYSATLEQYTFEDPQQEAEFRDVIEQMRCLVCQNESLAGSNAELAVDLRNEIYDMMSAGKTKNDIVDFMVARYGDFVLYSPPMKPSTYPLWFGPVILFLIGGVLLARILLRKKQTRETELSTEEQQRLSALLNEQTDTRKDNQ
jgi:cytochrome c-type biogenesis protein CcmH